MLTFGETNIKNDYKTSKYLQLMEKCLDLKISLSVNM